MAGKSIGRSKIEGQFETLLQDIQPSSDMVQLTKDVALALWQEKLTVLEAKRQNVQRQISDIETEISALARRAAKTTSDATAKACEREIDELERKRLSLEEKTATPRQSPNFETCLNDVLHFLEEPHKRWQEGGLRQRQQVLKMVFGKPLVHDMLHSFETTKLSPTYALISTKAADVDLLVHPAGLEPTTLSSAS